MKNGAVKSSAASVLGGCATKFPHMATPVVTGLVDLINKHEHLPAVVADLAELAAARHEVRACGRGGEFRRGRSMRHVPASRPRQRNGTE